MTFYTTGVSEEPLSVIRANECDHARGGLTTSRFRRVWNELEHLRGIVRDVRLMANSGQLKQFEGEPWLKRAQNITLAD